MPDLIPYCVPMYIVTILKTVSFKSRGVAMISCQNKISPRLTNLKERPMLYTGIDLHRHVIALCTVNENGTVVARSRVKTDPAVILVYFRQWPS